MLIYIAFVAYMVVVAFSASADYEKRKYFKRLNESIEIVDLSKYQNEKEK